jgi:hypothetical protein
MAISNRDRLGKALDQLRDGLLSYISRQLNDNLGSDWQTRLPPGPTESQAQGSWRGHAGAGFVGVASVRWPTPLPLLI